MSVGVSMLSPSFISHRSLNTTSQVGVFSIQRYQKFQSIIKDRFGVELTLLLHLMDEYDKSGPH